MKTNGARFLESLGIPFELREYEVDPNDLSAITVAKKIGMPAEQVFKTLLTTDGADDLCLRRHSRRRRARLQEAGPRRRNAQSRDGSAQRRAAAHRLHPRRRHRLRREESLIRSSSMRPRSSSTRISVSAGTRGTQLILAPDDYLRAAAALGEPVETADLTKDPKPDPQLAREWTEQVPTSP